MSSPIALLNPNSSRSVTEGVAAAVRASHPAQAEHFEFHTLHAAPAGIVTQEDADVAAELALQWIEERQADYSAFGLACFSDPGIAAVRAMARVPVLGLGESGLRAALALGQRVGVVAVADAAIPRHLRYWAQLGLAEQVVGERAVNLTVAQTGDPELALARVLSAARALIDEAGADVILLGCAGMAPLCPALREALEVPLVEPCDALARALLQSAPTCAALP